MPRFGQWIYTVDRDGTIAAYQRAERGGADTCDCANCRNFRLARMRVLPPAFVTLLEELGIDPKKDGEVYHTCRRAPGRHEYGGWYHFVGTLDGSASLPHVSLGERFEAWMTEAYAPHLKSFDALPIVQLAFYTDTVPWLLDEAEPD